MKKRLAQILTIVLVAGWAAIAAQLNVSPVCIPSSIDDGNGEVSQGHDSRIPLDRHALYLLSPISEPLQMTVEEQCNVLAPVFHSLPRNFSFSKYATGVAHTKHHTVCRRRIAVGHRLASRQYAEGHYLYALCRLLI